MSPCIVMVPLAAYLTRKAINDAQLFSTEKLDRFIAWVSKKMARQDTEPKVTNS